MDQKKGLTIAVVVLALALLGSLIWGFNKNSEANTLETDNAEVKEALDAMTQLRDQLAREVDSLAGEYDLLASENVELNGQLAGSRDELANVQAALSKAKRNSAAEINDLRAQIEALQSARGDLQSSISALETENASLREQMGILETDLASSRQQNEQLTNLATSMEGEIKKLTYDNFKASGFQVTPEVNRGNPTSKSGRARRVVVSFDVANVPAEFQGVRPLYLTITDDKGTPIPRTKYINTSIVVNGQRQDIMAVEAREENLGADQRITFTHELENKLDEGYYRAAIYTDIGFLGSAQFRMQ
ncbi:MAG: hypothetical protein R2795_06880 [Saprospiraceae bacterium]